MCLPLRFLIGIAIQKQHWNGVFDRWSSSICLEWWQKWLWILPGIKFTIVHWKWRSCCIGPCKIKLYKDSISWWRRRWQHAPPHQFTALQSLLSWYVKVIGYFLNLTLENVRMIKGSIFMRSLISMKFDSNFGCMQNEKQKYGQGPSWSFTLPAGWSKKRLWNCSDNGPEWRTHSQHKIPSQHSDMCFLSCLEGNRDSQLHQTICSILRF